MLCTALKWSGKNEYQNAAKLRFDIRFFQPPAACEAINREIS
jgi:hypothetical protein